MTLDLTLIGVSDQGRIRERNEDSFRLLPASGLAVVADGMGGHPAGREASALAIEVFAEYTSTFNGDWGARMAEGVEAAHRRLVLEGEIHPPRRGMGTTLTALRVDRDDGSASLVHVGDSRAYRLRDGTLSRLSRDHTWVQEEVDAGRLDPDGIGRHPLGHVLTRVVGGGEDPPVPQLRSLDVAPGDLYMLCTDGLTAHLSDDDISEILLRDADSPGALATDLVAAANEGGGTDNVTVVIVQVRAD
jgi:protein phosphatase